MSDTPLKIAAVGDIMLDREVGQKFFSDPNYFQLDEIRSIFDNYDLVLGNLENPIGVRGAPHPKQDPHVAFRAHPQTLAIIKELGIDILTIGNNHLLDYGEITLLDTLEHLEQAQIPYVGGGRNYEDANKPLIIERGGHKIAILASVMIYSASTQKATNSRPGVADYKIGKILKTIKQLSASGHTVIVTVHWGIEYCFYPLPYQRHQAKRMIDAGASLILGHGPHFPQGVETYGTGQIVHSLGNFIFDEPYSYAKKSFIYGADLDSAGNFIANQIFPVTLDNLIPVLDPKGPASRTATIVNRFGEVYRRKNKSFWKKINSRWFSDIVWRISTMKSWKFALLPPPYFYLTIGFGNILKKLSFSNLFWVFTKLKAKLLNKGPANNSGAE